MLRGPRSSPRRASRRPICAPGRRTQRREGRTISQPSRRIWEGSMLARFAQLFVLLSLLTGTAASAAPEAIPTYQRAYFLADEGKFSYWSFDPSEEGANARTMVRTCPSGIEGSPCYTGTNSNGERYWQFSFNPHSVVEGSVAWNASNPLRYHLELVVDLPIDYQVTLLALSFSQGLVESSPATQVAP